MRLRYADYWDFHHRKSIRLPWHDYAAGGIYFVTICTGSDKECLFGGVQSGALVLNDFGRIAYDCWMQLPRHFPFVSLDAFVVMPNHVHGIVKLECQRRGTTFEFDDDPRCRGTACRAPTTECRELIGRRFGEGIPRSLSSVIGSYKSAVTKQINVMRDAAGEKIWQRNYYERIIRSYAELDRIRHYIEMNPKRWVNNDLYDLPPT
jgi:REP element-mobilizing transposase RayT